MDTPWTPPNAELASPKPGEPPLFRAAREGDQDAIRRHIAAGDDPNAVFNIGLDPYGCDWPATPLMIAAGSGDGATVETVELLLGLGADPAIQCAGRSAATFAATGLGWNYRPGGDGLRLRRLLEAGSPLPGSGPAAALLVARTAATGDADRLALLLDRSPPANPVWDQRVGAHRAANVSGDLGGMEIPPELGIPGEMAEAFQELYASLGERVEAMAREGLTRGPYAHEIPLFAAAASGSAECVRLLLDRGAQPDVRDTTGRGSLFVAGSAEVVKALIDAGADPRRLNRFDEDALHEALGNYNSEPIPRRRGVVEALCGVGFGLEHENGWGNSRLQRAAFEEAPHAVELLLELGHPVRSERDGSTALHAICWHWDNEDEELDAAIRRIVRALLRAGFSPEVRDSDGNTPLHEAITGDGANLIAAEVLIEHGADANAQNNAGDTPLHHLYDYAFDYARVVPFLLVHGANPLIKNNAGRTVIDLARDRAAGGEPGWRIQQWEERGGTPCGWKDRAVEGDPETAALRMLEKAASRFAG